ncbi:hypothetical protein L3139_28220, partial [[Brevibacterium] frigoritolerans]|nr:hypothetical protein [Peribacillus frigoritolerans]
MAPVGKNVKMISITAAVVTGVSIGAYMAVDSLSDDKVNGVSQKATTRESEKNKPDKSDKDLGFDFEVEDEEEDKYDDLVAVASKPKEVDSSNLFAYQNEESVNEYAFHDTEKVQAKVNKDGQFAFNDEQMESETGIDIHDINDVVATVDKEKTETLISKPVISKPEPEVPANPQPEPEVPANPQPEPEVPANPQPEPEQPTNPQPEPEQPTNPQPEPEKPTDPVEPPVEPEKPTDPVEPPVEPEQPTDPVEPPVEPEKPTDPVEPPVEPE